MDIRHFCHVETTGGIFEDEVSAPVEKRPRTELLDANKLSEPEASQTTSMSDVDEDENDFDHILGEPENADISHAQKILTSQQKTVCSTNGAADLSQLPDDGPMQPGLKKEFNFPKSHGRRFTAE